MLDPNNPKALAPAADDDHPESRSLESNSPKQLSSAGDGGDDAVIDMPKNMVKWKERFYKLFWLSLWIRSSIVLIWIKWTSDSFSNAVRILMNNNK